MNATPARRESRISWWPWAMIAAAVWSVAPWAVGPLGIEALAVLFPVGILMALWFAAVGVGELIRRRASTPTAAHRAAT